MKDEKTILNEIINTAKKLAKNRSYLRITEYERFYFVAIDDFTDPMIFDKSGNYTGRNFVEIKSEDIQNPKQIYYEG